MLDERAATATSLPALPDTDDDEPSTPKCWRCNDTGRVEASSGDWIGERDCPDCGPQTYEDYEHD